MKDLKNSLRWSHILMGATALSVLGADIASAQIDEIVVTARKREESLQSVPVAVSAFSSEELTRSGINEVYSLSRFVPSLDTTRSGTSASITQFVLRGQSAGDTLMTVDQAVGVYQDGVANTRVRGIRAALFDLERVEVLKGPQGTLYGRNTNGGVINLISKGADYDGIHGYVAADAGNHSLLNGRFAVNVPVIEDQLAVRVGYQRSTRNGYGESAFTGQDFPNTDQHFFRGSLVADPFEGVNVEVKGEWYKSRENNNFLIPGFVLPAGLGPFEAAVETGALSQADALAIIGGAVPTASQLAALGAGFGAIQSLVDRAAADPFTNFYDQIQKDNVDMYSIAGTINVDLSDNVRLKSVTGYRETTTFNQFDLDGTNFNILEVGVGTGGIPLATGKPGSLSSNFSFENPNDTENKFFSQEFNLSGEAWDGRLNWAGGVYYSNENGTDVQTARVAPAVVPIAFINDGEEIQNTSWAIFSQNDLELMDDLTLTFGGRYTEERKSLTSRLVSAYDPSSGFGVCGTGVPGAFFQERDSCRISNEATFSGFSWLGSLNYQIRPETLIYVKTARGFRGGAFQLRAPLVAPAGPETARDVEIGIKSDFFDNRLRVNLAGFTTKYGNKQESIIITTPSGALATVIQNAATAGLKGFEAEIFANPITGLTFRGTASYITGKYDAFPGALRTDGGGAIDAGGEKFSNPPWMYSLMGRYEHPIPTGSLGAQIDWAWKAGAQPPDRLINAAFPSSYVDNLIATGNGGNYSNGRASLGLLNARVDYQVEKYETTVSFFMTNVLDEEVLIAGIDPSNTGGVHTQYVGEPRMWGFTIRKAFGGE